MKLENVEHVIMKCPRYGKEKKILIDGLKENKEKLNLMNILGNKSGDKNVQCLMRYLKDTGLYNRI